MKKKERLTKKHEVIEQKRMSVADTFVNQMARLGANAQNALAASEYPITRLTRDYNLMNSLYRNNWIAKKIINTIPDDMCKNWFTIQAEMSPDAQDRYNKLEQKTKTRAKILEALYWGRLYGGAGALMLIDGHEDALEDPLKAEDVMPDSYKGLLVVDRWSGIYPSAELITDINDPDFGLPEYYEIRNHANQQTVSRVHHTRVIRFEGRKLPFWENQAEMHWGAAELEHVFEELLKRDNTSWNIAALIFQANLLVDKVDGLDQLVAFGDPQAQQDFYNVKLAQNAMRSNQSLMLVGKEEEVTQMQYTYSGLNDIYESFMLDVAGAAEIPVTRLFGRSPAGLNSTGESDMQNFDDMIGQKQNTELKPKLDKLLPVMFMSEFGKVPDDLTIKFNPIRTPTDEKMADLVGKKVDSIDKVYNSGIINQKIAMQELHEMSYTSNMFTSITDEDIASAKTDFNDEGEMEDFTNEFKNDTINKNDEKDDNDDEKVMERRKEIQFTTKHS